MYEIYYHPEITARQIKAIIGVDEGYLSRLINKLVKQNIVIKEKSKTDSRISTLKLSYNGKKIYSELNQKSTDSIAELISNLNQEEQNELVAYFQKIKTLLTKHNENEH